MDTHEAIRTRRTAHSWRADAVPEEVIHRALASAHCAPCHYQSWPWRFTLPGPRTRAAITGLGTEIKAKKSGTELSPAFAKSLEAKLVHPALVVVSQVLHEDPARREEDYAACACAVQNLSLSLRADGFHSKWATGAVTRHSETYQILGIPAEEERIIGFVWIGVPSREPAAPVRPEVQTHIRRTE